jgi:hypothetical protein
VHDGEVFRKLMCKMAKYFETATERLSENEVVFSQTITGIRTKQQRQPPFSRE